MSYPSWICEDCGKDCRCDNRDYYMVQDALWQEYGAGKDMLCLSCLQQRVGRLLTAEDFTDCALNNSVNFYVAFLKSQKEEINERQDV